MKSPADVPFGTVIVYRNARTKFHAACTFEQIGSLGMRIR